MATSPYVCIMLLLCLAGVARSYPYFYIEDLEPKCVSVTASHETTLMIHYDVPGTSILSSTALALFYHRARNIGFFAAWNVKWRFLFDKNLKTTRSHIVVVFLSMVHRFGKCRFHGRNHTTCERGVAKTKRSSSASTWNGCALSTTYARTFGATSCK